MQCKPGLVIHGTTNQLNFTGTLLRADLRLFPITETRSILANDPNLNEHIINRHEELRAGASSFCS
jgi:hypothetical protein